MSYTHFLNQDKQEKFSGEDPFPYYVSEKKKLTRTTLIAYYHMPLNTPYAKFTMIMRMYPKIFHFGKLLFLQKKLNI